MRTNSLLMAALLILCGLAVALVALGVFMTAVINFVNHAELHRRRNDLRRKGKHKNMRDFASAQYISKSIMAASVTIIPAIGLGFAYISTNLLIGGIGSMMQIF